MEGREGVEGGREREGETWREGGTKRGKDGEGGRWGKSKSVRARAPEIETDTDGQTEESRVSMLSMVHHDGRHQQENGGIRQMEESSIMHQAGFRTC